MQREALKHYHVARLHCPTHYFITASLGFDRRQNLPARIVASSKGAGIELLRPIPSARKV
jgi:hypothetical protein